MDKDHFSKFANQMLEGVMGMQKSIEENVKSMVSKMSKEDAEKFNAAMKDSKIQEMAAEQAKKIIEINKFKVNVGD